MHVEHLRAMTAAGDKAFTHSASAAVRRDFGSAIAELHSLAGWTAFDAGLDGSAHRHFDLAPNFAQDGDLVANIRCRMGRVHLHHGGPAKALGMFRLVGLVVTSHHTNAILAAWCYAELG